MLALRANGVAFRPAVAGRPVRVVAARAVVPCSSSVLSGLAVGERLEASALASPCPSAGMKWTMMRHGNKVKHLGRPADQRKALIRSLVTEVIRHGAIRTTKVKAKVIRPFVDHMITLAKQNTLHSRRQVMAFLYDKELVSNLFDNAAQRYADRAGGYTRVKPDPNLRRGDATEMAVIELV